MTNHDAALPVRQHILGLKPYALPDNSGPAGKSLLQLSQNESFFGVSPRVTEAINQASNDLFLYPDPDTIALRSAIADVYQLDADKILCGGGSISLIGSLATVFCEPDSSVVTSEYSYLYFRTAVKLAAGNILIADEPNFTVDIEAILATIRPDTRLVFIANPGNPTGTVIPNHTIRNLRSRLPANILLIVDEAYGEYMTDTSEAPLFDLVNQGSTVILRTFSKIYGLAGLRVGWGYFPPTVIDYIRRIQLPNTVSSLASVAAIAAVQDQAYIQIVRDTITDVRDQFTTSLQALGITVIPSQTNFVLCQFISVDEAQDAFTFLKSEGIIVRPVGGYGLPDCLRITLAPAPQMERVEQAFRAWAKS